MKALQQRRKSAQVHALSSTSMSHASASSLTMRGAAAVAAALTLSGAPSQANAQPHRPSHPPQQAQGGLLSDTEENTARRYATPDGSVRFVFDRTGGRVALVRFEGDPEVHILRPTMGAHGDEIYRTENGDVYLRVTPQGGIIVYTRLHRTGAPASEVADADPLTPEAIAIAVMRERMRQLQALAARQMGQSVTFEPPPQMSPQASGVVMDAAERAAQGLTTAPLTGVRHVVILLGPQPGAVLRGDTLIIVVTPQLGYAGRPSSVTVRNVATGQMQGPEQ